MMIEQPLAWDDLLRHVELQKRLKTPICLDESITSVGPRGGHDRPRRRPDRQHQGRPGGRLPAVARPSTTSAQRHGIPVWCGGMLESGVGRAHNVALASLPNFTLPGDVSPSERYWEQDIVHPRMDHGPRGVGERPGGPARAWACEVDLDRVDDLTVRREELRAGCRGRRCAMFYRLLADLVVVLHFGFVLFVVLGGLLALRWPRAAWFHLPAALWGAGIEFVQGICPLTPLENHLRGSGRRGGLRRRLRRALRPAGPLSGGPHPQRATGAGDLRASPESVGVRRRLAPPPATLDSDTLSRATVIRMSGGIP